MVQITCTSQNLAFETLMHEFLNSLKTLGLSNHKLKLKVGTPFTLLGNLDQFEVLCNSTRLIVMRLGSRVIEVKIILVKNIGNFMSISFSQSSKLFELIRRQILIIVSFVLAINKL